MKFQPAITLYRDQKGKIYIRFLLWPSIILSIVLSILLTIILNLVL